MVRKGTPNWNNSDGKEMSLKTDWEFGKESVENGRINRKETHNFG